MRTAKIAEYWRAIESTKRRPLELKHFSFANIAGLRDDAIAFDAPITAICGLNGSGKSAVLRAIWAALDQESIAARPDVLERLKGGSVKTKLAIADTDVETTFVISEGKCDPPLPDEVDVQYLDLARFAPHLQDRFCGRDVRELLAAYEPIELKKDEVQVISFVCRKEFRDVKIYEIDEFDGNILPFIEASDGDFSYDIRTMSSGEISVIVCYWAMRRAKPGAIILMEEPEAYISPASQQALIDFFAFISVTRNITIVFTTHSPQMFSRLNRDSVRFLFRDSGGSKIATVGQFEHMRRLVGLQERVDAILVVEDRAAREFTRLLLGRLDVGLLARAEIVDVNGSGNITTARRTIPRSIRSVKFVGVYDGDERDKVKASNGEWPFVFLPGLAPPEQLFRSLCGTAPALVAQRLGRDVAAFQAVLAGLQGQDPHEWFENLVKGMGMSYEQVMLGCFEAWFSQERNAALSAIFLEELRKVLS